MRDYSAVSLTLFPSVSTAMTNLQPSLDIAQSCRVLIRIQIWVLNICIALRFIPLFLSIKLSFEFFTIPVKGAS